jgi:hypothetical protein
MILITTYYKSKNENRQKEIDTCLRKNNENIYIEKIYLLNNEIYDLSYFGNKIVQIIISKDKDYILKFNDAINFINNNLKNKICILSNSDIYFNESLSKINNKNLGCRDFFALLRYDEDINGNIKIFTRHDFPRDDSQDSWIFKSPLNVDLDELGFSFRTLGCDSIFSSIVHESNFKVTNPSLDIITIHLHLSNYRTYTSNNIIHGKYCLIKPCYLNEEHNVSFIDY